MTALLRVATMRTRVMELALLVGILIMSLATVYGLECSICAYAAWNCSAAVTDTGSTNAVALADDTVTSTDLRREPVPDAQRVEVCNAAGQIQVDDIFCDRDACQCASGRQCVAMQMGCRNIFQVRSRTRCLGESAIALRFQRCAMAQALTDEVAVNLDADWVYFNDLTRCVSADCLAVRRFHQCNAVQCGNLVVAWKEPATGEFRFVVDGSRSSDMAAGTFLFNASIPADDDTGATTNVCKSVTSVKIDHCFSLQTRNQKNGTCDGVYMQLDTALQAQGEKYELSKLSWPVWLAVVGSVIGAVAAIMTVAVVYYRVHRGSSEDETSELLSTAKEGSERRVDSTADKLEGADTDAQPQEDALSPRALRQRANFPAPRSVS